MDKVDHLELTPLQYACMDEGIVRLLVEHGAMDPEAAKADAVMAEVLAEEEEASTNKKEKKSKKKKKAKKSPQEKGEVPAAPPA